MNHRRWSFIFCVIAFAGVAFARAETAYVWPERSPQLLREEIFSIRFRLTHENVGPKGAEKFLRAALAKDPAPHVKAWVARTSLYAKGWEMSPLVDPATAEKMATEAAAAGSAVAADVLGRAKIFGDAGLPKDEATGYALVTQAAAAGFARAIAMEGRFYILGSGRPRDVLKGANLIRQAAELGSTIGLSEAAADFESGAALGQPSLPVAMENYFWQARYDSAGWKKLGELAEKGVPNARFLYLLARVHNHNEGVSIAPTVARGLVKELEALESNDARAWVEIGVAHLWGDYAKRDYALARQLFEKAVITSEDARLFLAYMQCYGLGMEKDVEAGLARMEQLAAQGNARAATWLGVIYYWGHSDFKPVKKDAQKAFRYTRQAAESGDRRALVNLGFFYDHGIGTPVNYTLAAILHWRAYQEGVAGTKEKAMRDLAFVKLP